MTELCGSILAANHAFVGRDLKLAEDAGVKRFHIDVCDGHYTPFFAFGDQLVKDLRETTSAVFEAHLAVHNMPAIAETFLNCGLDILTIQYESCELPSRLIRRIRSAGLSPGISFIPATAYEQAEFFLDEVDFINVLGVDPGIGGQDFNPKVLKKIERIAEYITRHNLPARISVDGGVNPSTMKAVVDAGADILTFGSAIFSGNIEENIDQISRGLKNE